MYKYDINTYTNMSIEVSIYQVKINILYMYNREVLISINVMCTYELSDTTLIYILSTIRLDVDFIWIRPTSHSVVDEV